MCPYRLLLPLVFVFVVAEGSRLHAQLTFNDNVGGAIEVRNQYFSMQLNRQSGHLRSLRDNLRGQELLAGTLADCAWSVEIVRNGQREQAGACNYSPQSANTFRYDWNPTSRELRLSYFSSDGTKPNAISTLRFFDGPYIDFQMQIQNITSGEIEGLTWPGSFLLNKDSIEEAYLPLLLPGVRLKREFFQSGRSAVNTYPGQQFFADLIAVNMGGTLLSLRGIQERDAIRPILAGLANSDVDKVGTYAVKHAYSVRLKNLEVFTTPVIRLEVGSSVESIVSAYRKENGIDLYPSIQQKLGEEYEKLAQSPVVRADFTVFNRSINSWIQDLNRLRAPSIIHLVGFQPGGHDRSYPDHLPPNPVYGTNADLRRFVDAARELGHTVVPHTNYSWWDRTSPTLRTLPDPTLRGLMVQNSNGQPLVETYGNGVISNDGLVVSPSVGQVRNRVEQAWEQWRNEIGVNRIFLDQLGSRNEAQDYNPQASSPFEYHKRWVDIVNGASTMSFATEGSFDRLAERLWGFFGSALSSQNSQFRPTEVQWGVGSPGNQLLGPGNWEPYPLASFLYHDKAFSYQHNLELTTYTESLEVLTWNCLFGYHQMHLWPGTPTRSPDPQWVDLAQSVQRSMSARQAGQKLNRFNQGNSQTAVSQFGDVTTVANWSTTNSFSIEGSTVVPNGFLTFSEDFTLFGGTFESSFLGQPLSPGMHALILERYPDVVSLRRPIGSSNEFVLEAPSNWSGGDAVLSTSAVDADNNWLGAVGRRLEGRNVRLTGSSANGSRISRLLVQTAKEVVPTDAAAFLVGPVSPGQMISLFASAIGPERSESVRLGANGRIETELAGIRVLVNEIAAPLLFVSANQINLILPYQISGKDVVPIQVIRNGIPTAKVLVPVVNAMPRLFTQNGTGSGLAAALNQNGSLLTAQSAAPRGSVITLYGTGGGMENGNPQTGELARDATRTLRRPVRVMIDNRPAEVLYAGAAPGYSGMFQLNVRVPPQTTRGNAVAIEVRVGETPTQSNVTIAVQ